MSQSTTLARLLHLALSTFFTIYITLRRLLNGITNRISALLRFNHKSPDIIKRDVEPLDKVPSHLSVILSLPNEPNDVTLLLNRLDIVLHDACELAAWSTAAGIPVLSIYERTGLLKSSMTHLHRRVEETFRAYYIKDPASKPTFSLFAPNLPAYNPPQTNGDTTARRHLNIILLDASDGRQAIVDLTRTLAEMTNKGQIKPHEISADLIDAELSDAISEPDLLILFGGKVLLDGYPPWQVRLTEIFALQDNTGGVGYSCFLRALYKYAKAEMRLGR